MEQDAKPDALTPTWRVRGRGADINPANRFDGLRLHVLGEHLEELRQAQPHGSQIRTEIFPDRSRSIINHVDSPYFSFNWTINPYRGCEHGCSYCYARPTHEMLGYSCGVDFETKILAKFDAPSLLKRELANPRWKPQTIVMSGVTDPYQPIERELRITRGILEVLAEARQPVSLITKNRLITRDIDLLSQLSAHGSVRAAVSITTLDARLSRSMEPRASAPSERLRAVRELSDAGIPVVVMIAPVAPGLNDHEIPALLEAAAEAGAVQAGWILLHMPFQVEDVFLDWLRREFPGRAARVESLVRQMRGGLVFRSRSSKPQRGDGALAANIKATFELFRKRFGLQRALPPLRADSFRRPSLDGQLSLFADST